MASVKIAKKIISKVKEDEKLKTLYDNYQNIIIAQVTCNNSNCIHQLRDLLRLDSVLLYGRRKILQKGLMKLNILQTFVKKMSGDFFLIFSNREFENLREFLSTVVIKGFLKAGIVAEKTLVVEGRLEVDEKVLPTSNIDLLKKLGVDCKVENGCIVAERTVLCEEGIKINTEQAKLLKIFGYKLGEMKVNVIDCYKKEQ